VTSDVTDADGEMAMDMRSFFKGNYRLLALITAVLAGVLVLCWLGMPFARRLDEWREAYARELSAAKRVEALGGKVHWEGSAVCFVYIEGGKFADGMADALSHLSDLKVIIVWVDVPSDRAIARLKKLRCLGMIDLSGPETRDTTIACLQDVKGLRDLSLGSRAITDAGLSHFADFASLEYLRIDGGAITDAGVRHLKNLRNLKGLDLRNIALTDAGLAELRNLKKLKTLRLYDCKQITARGVQTLQQALPNTSIGWDKSAIPGDLF
jgi:hypothetical protein